ncbi:MAG: hypothetical protein JW750_10555 [Anaerolineaceae bacterium]|nr:hypothetical protein [Anaerolineaceae bacterium]
MTNSTSTRTNTKGTLKVKWNQLYQISAVTAFLQLAVVAVYFVVIIVMGVVPESLEAYYQLLQDEPLNAMLRGDLFNVLLVGLYLGLFPGVFFALRRDCPIGAGFATLFTFIAVFFSLSANSDFSMLHLSQQYAQAATEAQRAQIIAAGEAVTSMNMWNSTSAYLCGLFLQGSGVWISILMLKNKQFSKVTAIVGLLSNGLDLIQHLIHPFTPSLSEMILRAAGPFYLIWYPMLGRDFLRLRKLVKHQAEEMSEED